MWPPTIVPTSTFATGHRSCCFCVLEMNATDKMSATFRPTLCVLARVGRPDCATWDLNRLVWRELELVWLHSPSETLRERPGTCRGNRSQPLFFFSFIYIYTLSIFLQLEHLWATLCCHQAALPGNKKSVQVWNQTWMVFCCCWVIFQVFRSLSPSFKMTVCKIYWLVSGRVASPPTPPAGHTLTYQLWLSEVSKCCWCQ